MDGDGVTWSCIQVFAGLGSDPEKADAARVDGENDRLHVACTPSGGAKSVRLKLPAGWEEELSDEELIEAVQAKLDEG
jgi:hypothetical protein